MAAMAACNGTTQNWLIMKWGGSYGALSHTTELLATDGFLGGGGQYFQLCVCQGSQQIIVDSSKSMVNR